LSIMMGEMMPRMGKRGHRVCGLIMAAAGTLVSNARAQEPGAERPGLVLIHIRASDPCFDHARFVRELRARLPEKRVELTTANAQAEVQVVRHEQGYQAELVLHAASTATRHRTISSRTCDEAADGVAFITSVALEERPPAAEQAPKSQSPGNQAPAPRDWEVRAAVGAQLAFAVLPKTTVGPALSVYGGHRRAGWWSPGIELGFIVLPPVHITEPAGVARFSLWQFTLDLCPSQAKVHVFWLRPCAYGTAGRLRSEGRDTEDAQLRHRPYLTAGAELVVGADVGRFIDLIVRGSWAAALIVDSYQFNDEIFYEQDPFSYGLGAQLSVTLF
jgi:hypothetical protein